jgi:hypothetical protein
MLGCVADLILAGVLMWLLVLVWWGTELALRAGGRERVIGGVLIALGLVPALIALWLST